MLNQPGYEKDNDATRIAREVKRLNAESGRAAGRAIGTPTVSGGPVVRITTAAQAAEFAAAPLSLDEQARLDEEAQKIGILPRESEAPPSYPSLEAAIKAGESVNKPPDTPPVPVNQSPLTQVAQMVQPQPSSRNLLESSPKLVDFTRIQGIDLMQGKAYVDGFDIPMPEKEVRELKGYVLDLAVSFVTAQVAKAMLSLKTEETDAKPEGEANKTPEVQSKPEGSSPTTQG